jgi:prepilin-type processing-associated H-X9-DG protein
MTERDDAPSELRVSPQGAALAIAWADGAASLIAARDLRRACRCAACTAARATGKPAAGEGEVSIAAVEPLGNYAVNIAFSDGHARGIYPWAFLHALGGP